VEEKDFFYYRKFVGRPKWGDQEFRTLTPKFSEIWTGKIAKLTAKIIHMNCQMQQDSHVPNAYIQMPDSSGAVTENWVKNQ